MPFVGPLAGLALQISLSRSQKARQLLASAAQKAARESPEKMEQFGGIAVTFADWLLEAADRTTSLKEDVSEALSNANAKAIEVARPVVEFLAELGTRIANEQPQRLREGASRLFGAAERGLDQLRTSLRGREPTGVPVELPRVAQALQTDALEETLRETFQGLVSSWNGGQARAVQPDIALVEGLRALVASDVYQRAAVGPLSGFVEQEMGRSHQIEYRLEREGSPPEFVRLGPLVLRALAEGAREHPEVIKLLAAALTSADNAFRAVGEAYRD
jgi:hypothetical protein